MKQFLSLLVLVSLLNIKCTSPYSETELNQYKLNLAFEGISFSEYRFFLATDARDSTYLIITAMRDSLRVSNKHRKIIYGNRYKLTLRRIDSVVLVRARNIDGIIDDDTGRDIFKNNRFLIPLYSAEELKDKYIEIK